MKMVLTNIRTIVGFAALCFTAAIVLLVFIPSALVALGCAALLWVINGLFDELDSWAWIREDMNRILGGEK